MIHVTQTYMPDRQKYNERLDGIWDRGWLTNSGPLVMELEEKLKEYLGLSGFYFCNNGTIVLQMALKALNITGEVITTPFSYVATTGALLWENCTPVFADINATDFNIDVQSIKDKITPQTEAILATHVFGNPCNVKEIEQLATAHGLKVIYDAAHAFGVSYEGSSLLSYGDISTCSFHATKIFHTGEGGAIICKDPEVNRAIYLMRQFGHVGNDYFSIGINGKSSELHAAMGLCVLEDMGHILERRAWVTAYYNAHLDLSAMQVPVPLAGSEGNYAYYPVVFSSETLLQKVMAALNRVDIFPRRYFYPSLNNLPYLDKQVVCPVSDDISSRILCLPLSTYLSENELDGIISIINNNL
jgi:dTDP-4-amino-4,6-dideoxygalactose transaminase